jgi:hypothetical protein
MLITIQSLNIILVLAYIKVSNLLEKNLLNRLSIEEGGKNIMIEEYATLLKNFNELKEEHQATKAELEQYKNEHDNS